jgi:5-methylthioribose kinase
VSGIERDILAALGAMGLIGKSSRPRMTPLSGGVSSEIWRVDVDDGASFCVKRALPKLRVDADWRVPTARNRYEYEWFRTVDARLPGAAPRVMGHDPELGFFAMEYLPRERYPIWKEQLAAGIAERGTAARVGDRLARIHRATSSDAALAARFATDELFVSLRLEPYLAETGRKHPPLGDALRRLMEDTLRTQHTLVHGDVSPKNIAIGPAGPVFLDAECAWFGDPAFDLAFCLNHLLLKSLWIRAARPAYLGCFDELRAHYLALVDWERADELEARAARLLPALLLARVDGKSPVEYLTRTDDRERVREVAGALIESPPESLATIERAWRAMLGP